MMGPFLISEVYVIKNGMARVETGCMWWIVSVTIMYVSSPLVANHAKSIRFLAVVALLALLF
jgi:hypothetical protein